MRLRLPPMTFEAAFGIESPDDATPSDHDDGDNDDDTGSDEPDALDDEPEDEE
jgi:hypothetical protein